MKGQMKIINKTKKTPMKKFEIKEGHFLLDPRSRKKSKRKLKNKKQKANNNDDEKDYKIFFNEDDDDGDSLDLIFRDLKDYDSDDQSPNFDDLYIKDGDNLEDLDALGIGESGSKPKTIEELEMQLLKELQNEKADKDNLFLPSNGTSQFKIRDKKDFDDDSVLERHGNIFGEFSDFKRDDDMMEQNKLDSKFESSSQKPNHLISSLFDDGRSRLL
jgi:hypothetical protein